jgi:hypothetical protein
MKKCLYNLIVKIYTIYASIWLKRNNFSEILTYVNKESISTGCEILNYYFIIKLIKKYRPNIFLELGSGKSTFIIAEALKRWGGANPQLISYEGKKKYYNNLIKIFNFSKYKFTRIYYSKIVKKTFFNISYYGYKKIAKKKYDMIFVDGPNVPKNFPNLDFLKLCLVKNKKGLNVIIDNRKILVNYLQFLFPTSCNIFFYKICEMTHILNFSSLVSFLYSKETINLINKNKIINKYFI